MAECGPRFLILMDQIEFYKINVGRNFLKKKSEGPETPSVQSLSWIGPMFFFLSSPCPVWS